MWNSRKYKCVSQDKVRKVKIKLGSRGYKTTIVKSWKCNHKVVLQMIQTQYFSVYFLIGQLST